MHTIVSCPECGATEFRFLDWDKEWEEDEEEIVICCECGADAPEGIDISQILNG
jgi:hypothetical protein